MGMFSKDAQLRIDQTIDFIAAQITERHGAAFVGQETAEAMDAIRALPGGAELDIANAMLSFAVRTSGMPVIRITGA